MSNEDEQIKAAFETFKALRRYEVIPEDIYFILEKSGKINFDNDTKKRIKAQVLDKIKCDLYTNLDFAKEYATITAPVRYFEGKKISNT